MWRSGQARSTGVVLGDVVCVPGNQRMPLPPCGLVILAPGTPPCALWAVGGLAEQREGPRRGKAPRACVPDLSDGATGAGAHAHT
jgi:hypothetical protein